MEISKVNKDGEFKNAVNMPHSKMTALGDNRFLLQIKNDVRGSTARENLERVKDILFPDMDEEIEYRIGIEDGFVNESQEGGYSNVFYFNVDDIEDVSIKDTWDSWMTDTLCLIIKNVEIKSYDF